MIKKPEKIKNIKLTAKKSNLDYFLNKKISTADILFVKAFRALAEKENKVLDNKFISYLTKLSKYLLVYPIDNDIIKDLFLDLNGTLEKMSFIDPSLQKKDLFEDLYLTILEIGNMPSYVRNFSNLETAADGVVITWPYYECWKKSKENPASKREFLRLYYLANFKISKRYL